MTSNNPMTNIMRLMAQGGNNPQMFAQQLLQQNPEFAKYYAPTREEKEEELDELKDRLEWLEIDEPVDLYSDEHDDWMWADIDEIKSLDITSSLEKIIEKKINETKS